MILAIMAVMVYSGGAAATYRLYKDAGDGLFSSFLSALVWPAALGEHLAEMCLAEDAEDDVPMQASD